MAIRLLLLLQAHNACEEAAVHLFCSLWQITSQPGKVDQSCRDASVCLSDKASWPDKSAMQAPADWGVNACICSSVGCMKECELA